MSLRNKLIVCSSLLAVTLIGVPSLASADDGLPVVREACSQETIVSRRNVGHPGNSRMLPAVSQRSPALCAVDKPKPLILASFTDVKGGTALVRGRAQRALEQLSVTKSVRPTADELTNLCVARIML